LKNTKKILSFRI